MKARAKTRLWRLAAIAIFCGMPVLLISAAVSNAVDATQAADETARERATTAMIIAQVEKHRVANKPVDTASLYLTSRSDTLARAEIQERANRLVAQAGGQLSEVQLTATSEQESQGTLAIQMTLTIDNQGLLDLLYTIESGLPLLDVTNLSIQASHGQTDNVQRADGALHVDMTVEGHWRKSSG